MALTFSTPSTRCRGNNPRFNDARVVDRKYARRNPRGPDRPRSAVAYRLPKLRAPRLPFDGVIATISIDTSAATAVTTEVQRLRRAEHTNAISTLRHSRRLHQSQQSDVPRKKVGHMTATCKDRRLLKLTLAKPEPSSHDSA